MMIMAINIHAGADCGGSGGSGGSGGNDPVILTGSAFEIRLVGCEKKRRWETF